MYMPSDSCVDFQKSLMSCLFSTHQMKDFSYLIGANFSDQKWVTAPQPIRAVENISLGTKLSMKHDLQLGSMGQAIKKPQRPWNILYFPTTITRQ